jgi:hypothetical protein
VRAASHAETPDDALEHLARAAAAVAFAPSVAKDAIDALDRELAALAAQSPALAERVESTRRSIRGQR